MGRFSRWTRALWTVRPVLLDLLGFGCLTAAGFTWSVTVGLVVAGASLIALGVRAQT